MKSEAEVEKLHLPERLVRNVKLPGETDFSFYCPHRASVPLGELVPATTAYVVGSGKVSGKDEVWVRVQGHTKYYWGFIKTDKYENVVNVKVPAEEIRGKFRPGTCGPDVTKQLMNGVRNVRTLFGGFPGEKREEMCDQLVSYVHGPVTWDFPRLHVRNWMEHEKCATIVNNPKEGCCANSVQVKDECHYAGSANYVLFGAMCRLCFDHYVAKEALSLGDVYDFSKKNMQTLIEMYKSDAPNFKASLAWASAGWERWPESGTSPPGDCTVNCSPSCPLPFHIEGAKDNEAFRARWCPHIDPVGSCKSWWDNAKDHVTGAEQ